MPDRNRRGRRGGAQNGGDWIFTGDGFDDPAAGDAGYQSTDRLPGRDEIAEFGCRLAPAPDEGRPALASPDPLEATPAATYARSGTTPSAAELPPRAKVALPPRFQALSWWDVVRDIVALIALGSAGTTTFFFADVGRWMLIPQIAIGLGMLGIVLVHLLRWLRREPPLGLIRALRVGLLVPGITVGIAAILADAAVSIPVLFAPLEGPPLGIGPGVALLLLGSILGVEPRAHEGFTPGIVAKSRTRGLLLVIAWAAGVFAAVALVMLIGRVFTTGWPYSLRTFAATGISVLLLVRIIGSGLKRERSRYVLAVAAVAGLALGAVADNSLRLEYAAVQSAATGYVYLPWLFAAFAVMVSRSFVRTMPLSFRRADWILYALRTLEFSIVMHVGAAIAGVLTAIAATGASSPGGVTLPAVDAALAVLFAVMSSIARRALLERPAEVARVTAVICSVVMVVVGFFDVIVNSLVASTGAGLMTGGFALVVGVAVALMLIVPAPVRDEYGTPDLVLMFEDFRRRDEIRQSLLDQVPDISEERARRKPFPGGTP